MDHRFVLRGDWGSVDCKVLEIEPNKTLSYTWAAMGLESVVTWTSLTNKHRHKDLRMEHVGFRPISSKHIKAQNSDGRSFLRFLEQVLAQDRLKRAGLR